MPWSWHWLKIRARASATCMVAYAVLSGRGQFSRVRIVLSRRLRYVAALDGVPRSTPVEVHITPDHVRVFAGVDEPIRPVASVHVVCAVEGQTHVRRWPRHEAQTLHRDTVVDVNPGPLHGGHTIGHRVDLSAHEIRSVFMRDQVPRLDRGRNLRVGRFLYSLCHVVSPSWVYAIQRTSPSMPYVLIRLVHWAQLTMCLSSRYESTAPRSFSHARMPDTCIRCAYSSGSTSRSRPRGPTPTNCTSRTTSRSSRPASV